MPASRLVCVKIGVNKKEKKDLEGGGGGGWGVGGGKIFSLIPLPPSLFSGFPPNELARRL